jgi:hypothetical protein
MAEDDTTDETETDETEPEGTEDGGESEKWEPPDKNAWAKQQALLKRLKAERDDSREKFAAYRREKDGEGEEAKQREEQAAKYVKIAKGNAAISALQALGYGKAQARTLAKTIDLSGMELDDDGDIDLGDLADDLTKAFPPERVSRGSGAKVTTGRGRGDSVVGDDVDTRFAKRLLGQL